MHKIAQSYRKGLSVLEVIVVLAIIALLVGLLLPAIQRVRTVAERLRSANNMRNISVATHDYTGSNGGLLPYFPHYGQPEDSNPLVCALRHIGMYQSYESSPEKWYTYCGTLFQNPLDPSYVENPRALGDCSYTANAQVFRKGRQLHSAAADGLSSTIAWAEQYANCNASGFLSNISGAFEPTYVRGRPLFWGPRRHSFADNECGDFYPVTANGVAAPVRDGWVVEPSTFSVRPASTDCKPTIPTASHVAGLQVAFLDGSIRTIAPSVSVPTFWALVSPDGGEVAGDW